MPHGGTLGVRVREITDWASHPRRGISVCICDTGAGIRPEDVEKIFQPFFSTKSTKGTGLGLWISKGIVQKYNGRISFRSYRHRGSCVTCFRVFFPGVPVSPMSVASATETEAERPVASRSFA